MNLQTSAKPTGARERTLDEVKAEFMRRAGRLNPFEDIRREDAERVMDALKSLDKDHWGEEWSKLGLAYEKKGDERAAAGASGKELAELYMHGFDACRVGRYPSPVSPGKLAAYHHSLRMFRKAAKHFEPKLEIIETAVRGQDAGRLSATAAGRRQAAGGAALGRRRWLEGRPAAHRQGNPALRHGVADHRHAGLGRESGALQRSGGRAHVFRLDGLHPDALRDRRRAACACGAAASAPTGPRGSPTSRRTASRARCSTAATSTTAFRRNGWCRPSPPAARPICSARTACSMRAAAPWEPRRWRNFWRSRRASRSRPWGCSTSRRRRSSASTASSTTRRRSTTSIC